MIQLDMNTSVFNNVLSIKEYNLKKQRFMNALRKTITEHNLLDEPNDRMRNMIETYSLINNNLPYLLPGRINEWKNTLIKIYDKSCYEELFLDNNKYNKRLAEKLKHEFNTAKNIVETYLGDELDAALTTYFRNELK